MLKRLSDLVGFTVAGPHGPVGTVVDILIDGDSWSACALTLRPSNQAAGELFRVDQKRLKTPDYGARQIEATCDQDELMKAKCSTAGQAFESLKGIHGTTADGGLGFLVDLVLDASWAVRYLVFDIDDLRPGSMTLISPEWIEQTDFKKRRLKAGVGRHDVKESPQWRPNGTVPRTYEIRLHDHYGRAGYWLQNLEP